MNNVVLTHSLRFIFLVLLQVLVLKQIPFGPIGSYFADPFVYPLFIMLLPVQTPRELLIILGFFIGMLIDSFYDSWGVHASASVFIAFVRPAVLRRLEPKGGYTLNYGLTLQRYKIAWYLRYVSLMLVCFLAFYFSMQVFTPVFFLEIVLKTILSFLSSMLFVFILTLIFNPLD